MGLTIIKLCLRRAVEVQMEKIIKINDKVHFSNGQSLSQIEVIRKTGKILVKQRKSSQTDKMYSQNRKAFSKDKNPIFKWKTNKILLSDDKKNPISKQ